MGNHLVIDNHKTSLQNINIPHYERNYYRLTLLDQLDILGKKEDNNLINDIKDLPNYNNLFKTII